MLKRMVQGALVGVALLALAATVGARFGWVTLPIERPAGHAFWQVSRAAGFAAYAALTLEMLLGLFLSTDLADRWIAMRTQRRLLNDAQFTDADASLLQSGQQGADSVRSFQQQLQSHHTLRWQQVRPALHHEVL